LSNVFTATEEFLLLDYFRAPYVVVRAATQLEEVRSDDTGRKLLYPRNAGKPWPWRLGSIRLFVGTANNDEMRSWLGEGWQPTHELETPKGSAGTAIWRSMRGDVALPFNPNEAITSFWSESYGIERTSVAGAVKSALRKGYYRARPLLPRRTQIAFRRALSHLQSRSDFPRWPVESSLHDLYDRLFAELRAVADAPVPTIAPWPDGRRWALVLTHDVETAVGASSVDLMCRIEKERGFRSSWNFVPHRYDVPDELLRDLEEEGFEIGVHGLKHDGRDLESLQTLEERLPEIRRYAERWRATGFRSPATHRRWDWMPMLGFDYDSSYPDTDPYEPQAGGCCSWLPFFNGNLVELPITLPQDYTLFTILRVEDERPWLEKAKILRERGGMALMITHPDYMLEQRYLDVYARLLDELKCDETLWRALPRDVSAWWRRRAESSLQRNGSGSGWFVDGPAAAQAAVTER
jgi:peptidoglycan/xylan/chitin deacetylase (PgdA/CDA1 family)